MLAPLPVADRIKPWDQDRRYWQYRGRPLLLLGGTREDNLFQIADLERELDILTAAGGNVIRNTMSDRDPGDEYPFLRRADGRYDLRRWNPVYWERVERLLRLTRERDIIVQIEVWDRFDLSDAKGMGNWQRHPLNPANNVTWTYEETGFADGYPDHPSKDRHPFYHSVPGMPLYTPKLIRVRECQEAFVRQLLRLTLPAGNVLYCMNNETSTDAAWGQFWIRFIKHEAAAAGVAVSCTDMFDDAFVPETSAGLATVLDTPDFYDFIEISQVNSRNLGDDHWRRVRWTTERAHATDRPVNHTKIYSDGETSFGSGTPQEGIARFWRNLLAGSASARFHRPTAGLGSSPLALHCLRAARLVERLVSYWDLRPVDDLTIAEIDDPTTACAYAARATNGTMVVFLPKGQPTTLSAPDAATVRVDWISVAAGARIASRTVTVEQVLALEPPLSGPMVAVIAKAS